MNENNNRVVAAEPVLNSTKETAPVNTDAAVKKPYYKHKKKVANINSTPDSSATMTIIAPATATKITILPIKPNWFQRQWNKFITWYNA